jgi:DNA polymerase III sliding clamp (beta) subunit (PCNA family)
MYNKLNFEVGKIAEHKENTHPVLQNILVKKDKTIATDGYSLAEVTAVDIPIDETPEPQGVELNGRALLIPAKSALEASKLIPKKASLPVLTNAWFSEIGKERATIVSTDLSQVNKTDCQIVEGNFPDYEQIFPKSAPKAKFKINASYLKRLCELFEKLDNSINTIDVEVRGETEAVVLTASDNKQKVRALLMPIRIQD